MRIGRLVGSAGIFAIGALSMPLLGATAPAATFAYHSSTQAPSGPVNVSCTVTVAPGTSGNVNVTLVFAGKPPMTLALPAAGAAEMPAPQGSPNPQRAQAQLILERVAMLGQIRKAKQTGGALAVKIPVLPPGAGQPLLLGSTLTAAGATLSGSAGTQTSATIDTQKARVHGLLPVRRVAERLKNAVQPKTVTLPDSVSASVTATLTGATLTQLSGTVNQTLSGNGKSVAIPETWTLTKT